MVGGKVQFGEMKVISKNGSNGDYMPVCDRQRLQIQMIPAPIYCASLEANPPHCHGHLAGASDTIGLIIWLVYEAPGKS